MRRVKLEDAGQLYDVSFMVEWESLFGESRTLHYVMVALDSLERISHAKGETKAAGG